jgi:hypothetical protein
MGIELDAHFAATAAAMSFMRQTSERWGETNATCHGFIRQVRPVRCREPSD